MGVLSPYLSWRQGFIGGGTNVQDKANEIVDAVIADNVDVVLLQQVGLHRTHTRLGQRCTLQSLPLACRCLAATRRDIL